MTHPNIAKFIGSKRSPCIMKTFHGFIIPPFTALLFQKMQTAIGSHHHGGVTFMFCIEHPCALVVDCFHLAMINHKRCDSLATEKFIVNYCETPNQSIRDSYNFSLSPTWIDW